MEGLEIAVPLMLEIVHDDERSTDIVVSTMGLISYMFKGSVLDRSLANLQLCQNQYANAADTGHPHAAKRKNRSEESNE